MVFFRADAKKPDLYFACLAWKIFQAFSFAKREKFVTKIRGGSLEKSKQKMEEEHHGKLS